MNASSRMEREALEKGKKQGRKESIETAVSVMSLCLLDSGLCANTTRRIAEKTFRLFESIGEKRLSLQDVTKTLKEEYDFEIHFV